MSGASLVSVVVPAREEVADIASCLDSVLAQDRPAASLEVIVGEIAGLARERFDGLGLSRVAILEIPAATTPSNLNMCLAEARCEYVGRADARNLIPKGYLRRCVELLGRVGP